MSSAFVVDLRVRSCFFPFEVSIRNSDLAKKVRSRWPTGRPCWSPTGPPAIWNAATAEALFALLLDVVRGTGTAPLIATHNPDLAQTMDRVMRAEQGYLLPVFRPALQPSTRTCCTG